MKPKVCLVNSGVKQDTNCHFPVGLGYIAASCVGSSIDVEIIDPTSMALNFNETVTRILASGCHIVGITGLLLQLKYSMNLAKAIKRKSPDIFIVMGGFQTIELEAIILQNSPVDLIIRGEGEIVFPELVHRLYAGKDIDHTPGAVYRKGDDIIFNDNIPILDNMDIVERPLYEAFPMEKYILNHYTGDPDKNTFYVMGSRGCPFKCSFCVNSKRTNKIRYRSPENIGKEIRFLKSNYGIDDLFMLDENITSNKSWLKDLAEILHAEGFHWVAMSRADMLDDDTLALLKSNGCSRMILGIESGSDLILKKMNKKADLKLYSTAIKLIRKHDIDIQTNFMIGMPDDTRETLRDTERFCIENNLVYGPSFLTPFPGTTLYDQVSAKLPPPLEYIDRLWDMEIRRSPAINVSRYSNSTLSRMRTGMVVNTAANLVSQRFKFLPMPLVKMICRGFLLLFDHLYIYPKIARKTDYIVNLFRKTFNK